MRTYIQAIMAIAILTTLIGCDKPSKTPTAAITESKPEADKPKDETKKEEAAKQEDQKPPVPQPPTDDVQPKEEGAIVNNATAATASDTGNTATDSADAVSLCGDDTPCADGEFCSKEKCVDDPCADLICSTSSDTSYGCRIVAALHFHGFTEVKEVQEYLVKLDSQDDENFTKFKAFNKGLEASLRTYYAAAYSYTDPKKAVKVMDIDELCSDDKGLGMPMTRIDGVHLMMRIKRHDGDIRKLKAAPEQEAQEPAQADKK